MTKEFGGNGQQLAPSTIMSAILVLGFLAMMGFAMLFVAHNQTMTQINQITYTLPKSWFNNEGHLSSSVRNEEISQEIKKQILRETSLKENEVKVSEVNVGDIQTTSLSQEIGKQEDNEYLYLDKYTSITGSVNLKCRVRVNYTGPSRLISIFITNSKVGNECLLDREVLVMQANEVWSGNEN